MTKKERFRSVVPQNAGRQSAFVEEVVPPVNPTPMPRGLEERSRSREFPLSSIASSPAPEIQPDVAAVVEISSKLGHTGPVKREKVQPTFF